jgi:ribosomal protein S18 acetylase RimI-like enzyme
MFRTGKPRDFDALFPVYMDPVINRFLGLEIMSKKEFLPIFKEITEFDTLYVCQNPDGEMAATCIVTADENRRLHTVSLTFFATNPKFQRQGIGSKFLTELLERIRKDKQIKRIETFFESDNEPALNFFKKHGFQHEVCLKKGCKRQQDEHYVDNNILALLYD